MFDIQNYGSFIAAIVVFQLVPGPGTLAILNATARNGIGAGLGAVLGTLMGDFLYMVAAVAGLAAVMNANPGVFQALQWFGAAYLCWIGVQLLRTRVAGDSVRAEPRKSGSMYFRQAFAVSLTNPKVVLFFVAFFPLFLRPDSAGDDPRGDDGARDLDQPALPDGPRCRRERHRPQTRVGSRRASDGDPPCRRCPHRLRHQAGVEQSVAARADAAIARTRDDAPPPRDTRCGQPAGPTPPHSLRRPFVYSKTLFAGWGDMDFNSHMKNTAFLDKSADVRMMYFAEHGFPTAEFARLKLGPVVMKDDLEYRKEVGLLQEITVTLAIAGLSADGSRFVLRNEILRPDGTLCARVTSAGGWLDLAARKLVAPPAPLLAALQSLPRTDDFAALPSVLRERA